MTSFDITVESPNVAYTEEHIEANYCYQTTRVDKSGNKIVVKPFDINFKIQTKRKVPKLGVMLIGWGGNNGTTFTAGVLANKHKIQWHTKNELMSPNWFGSITQSSTISLGFNEKSELIYVPMSNILPMVDPDNIAIDGWDISSSNLSDAMRRAKVLDYTLQTGLDGYMKNLIPRPSPYYPDFIAANQKERADNVLEGSKWDHVERIRNDIKDFKAKQNLDKVIVLWTANTERFAEIVEGVNDTAECLLKAIKEDSPHIAPSTIFAVASILEKCTFINGSPQNTLVPGCLQLAEEHGTFVAGDDFKSGQTKLKSVLVDFLVTAGIKPLSIASYNHLGNNDGYNLSSPQQFKSKEVSKSNVVDDMVRSNSVLYKVGEKPDHCIVIKYIPAVGDSKRAMDEYTSELMLGGRNTLAIHNTCEDSLLAAPIILDLVLIAELVERIKIKQADGEYVGFHSILSVLSYLCKAPIVKEGTPIVNSLFKQRACIENIFRACLSLPPENHMALEFKTKEALSLNNTTKIDC